MLLALLSRVHTCLLLVRYACADELSAVLGAVAMIIAAVCGVRAKQNKNN